jgi:3-methyladenine DNA glycosylase AlkC
MARNLAREGYSHIVTRQLIQHDLRKLLSPAADNSIAPGDPVYTYVSALASRQARIRLQMC